MRSEELGVKARMLISRGGDVIDMKQIIQSWPEEIIHTLLFRLYALHRIYSSASLLAPQK